MEKEFELFEKAGNKSVGEIEELLELVETSIRLYASRNLIGHDENNPLEINALIESNVFGLSTLEMLHATRIFQDEKEGIISVRLEGCEEVFDFNAFDIHDQVSIIKEM